MSERPKCSYCGSELAINFFSMPAQCSCEASRKAREISERNEIEKELSKEKLRFLERAKKFAQKNNISLSNAIKILKND